MKECNKDYEGKCLPAYLLIVDYNKNICLLVKWSNLEKSDEQAITAIEIVKPKEVKEERRKMEEYNKDYESICLLV